jgi:D-arabinose 1-dehydrogenase-like Zn-dependent alcohol dehydrogenase
VLLLAVASLWDNIRAHGDVAAGSAPERVADIELLLDLVARGDVTVVHDGDYDLEHIVDAYRRVDSGHKRGNVIVHPARRPRCSAMTTTVDDIVAARDQDP